MSLSVGGDSLAVSPQGASINGYIHVVSYMDQSGPDEYFYVSQSGSINYQLVQGDKLEYSVYADVYWSTSNYNYYFALDNTVSTPGSGSLNINVNKNYLFDLYSIDSPFFYTDFTLSATIIRGDSTVGTSSIQFDPGLSVAASSVPEPSSLVLAFLGLIGIGSWLRARANKLWPQGAPQKDPRNR
jgi:hypothetical protein